MRFTTTTMLLAGMTLAISVVQAQTSVRVRGTITGIDGTTLSVKSRDGTDMKLVVPDNATVAVAKALMFEDIKDGDYVGTMTKADASGIEVASEVHYLASTTPPGQSAWDLMPGSKMTNANVAAKVVGIGNRELTLQFPGGTQKVMVPDGTPIVRTVPGTRADLVVGEYVFAVARYGADGTLTAPRIQVSKDGVRPPQ